MGLTLFLVARLAARLIHPQAGWFAVFACLTLRGINYEAADARPYALGMCIAAAALLFLVRWFDSLRWRDGLLFVLFAALLWRVHLLFWPLYLVFEGYAIVRRKLQLRTAALFALAALSLVPVLFDALALLRDARAHAFAAPPGLRDFVSSLKLTLVVGCGAGAWLLARWRGWRRSEQSLVARRRDSDSRLVDLRAGRPVPRLARHRIERLRAPLSRHLAARRGTGRHAGRGALDPARPLETARASPWARARCCGSASGISSGRCTTIPTGGPRRARSMKSRPGSRSGPLPQPFRRGRAAAVASGLSSARLPL